MVQYYSIMGQKIGSHWLSIATLSTVFLGSWALSGGSKKPTEQGPKINASSKDEENFIQEFIKSAEADSKGAQGAKH